MRRPLTQRGQSSQPIAQVDDDALGGLASDTGNAGEPCEIRLTDRADEIGRLDSDSTERATFRSMPLTPISRSTSRARAPSRTRRRSASSRVRVDAQRHGRAGFADGINVESGTCTW